MKKTFRIENSWEGDVQVLQVVGDLTEHSESELDRVKQAATAKKIVIDLSKLTTMNSYGIALWCRFLQTIASNRDVSLIHCPRIFVDAANMVNAVTQGASIRSFMVPFYCKSCDMTKDCFVNNISQMSHLSKASMHLSCDKCKKEMTPDCELDDYLTFLSNK